jgi:synaptobrevin homolog YKT6
MVIFSCMIAVENEQKQVCIVHRDYEVSSVGYLLRNEVKNSFKFVVRESFPCVAKNTRNSVVHEDKVCHIQMSSKPVAAYAFVNQGYPERVIFAFLNKALEVFFDRVGEKWRSYEGDDNLAIEGISTLFNKYQDPNKADNLLGAIEQVQETKVILHESIKKLLERQGDLDKLVERSKDLSEGAKQFYKTSKKMDKSCCQLI